MTDLSKLEKKLGIKFNNGLLLKESLTHRSFLNENKNWPTGHNERLEFLGDAVLELAVTESLYEKYEKYDEGQLTSIRAALVNHVMLSKVAGDINLENFIFLSRGEAKGIDKAREAILANTVEALLGAIYLDQGYGAARDFVKNFVLVNLDKVMEEKLYRDPKSRLQEIVQEKLKITPHYEVLSETGPDHQKEFLVGVYFGDKLVAKGIGFSKQEAERLAAENALKDIDHE